MFYGDTASGFFINTMRMQHVIFNIISENVIFVITVFFLFFLCVLYHCGE